MRITKTEVNRSRHRWWHFWWMGHRVDFGAGEKTVTYHCRRCGWEFRQHYLWEL